MRDLGYAEFVAGYDALCGQNAPVEAFITLLERSRWPLAAVDNGGRCILLEMYTGLRPIADTLCETWLDHVIGFPDCEGDNFNDYWSLLSRAIEEHAARPPRDKLRKLAEMSMNIEDPEDWQDQILAHSHKVLDAELQAWFTQAFSQAR